MTSDEIWNDEDPIADRFEGIEVPEWIDSDISPNDVAAIVQGGCESGAYTPAVTYHEAMETMNEHGDDVLQYLEDTLGEVPDFPKDIGWHAAACHFLSTAVETWASGAYSVLENWEPEEDEDEAA